jgi:diguanylate cyclase (GGDEF)-like protein
MLPQRWPWRSAALRIGVAAGALTVVLGLLERSLIHSGGLTGYFVVGFAVAAGTYVVGRVFIQRPLDELTRAMDQATQSEFLARARENQPDEFEALARASNRLLAKITDLHVSAIEDARELAMKQEIEDKAAIIAQQNASLAGRLAEQQLLFDIAQTVGSTLDLATVLRAICDRASKALGYEEVAILLSDEATGSLVVRATHGFPTPEAVEGMTLDPGEGISGIVARTGQWLLIPDTSKDTRYLHYKGKHLRDGSFLCCPIRGQSRLLRLFNVLRPRSNAFSDADIRMVTSLATHAALAIANAQLHERVAALSVTDELTALPNRRFFQQRFEMELDRADRDETPFGILMIDIDHFKRLNDTLGHAKGDEALKRVATVLRAGLRKIDVLARFGGEEFVVLLRCGSDAHALHAFERLRAVTEAYPFPQVGRITVSIGFTAVRPEDNPNTAFERADKAVYWAKGHGRNQVAEHADLIKRGELTEAHKAGDIELF